MQWPSGKLLHLLERLHVSHARWMNRNKLLWHFMLGDFFRKSKGKRIRLPDVIRRFAVLDRVEDIVQSCRGAHPGAVFDFCLAHPGAGPAEFQELKNKICLVFRIAGHRIMSYVPPSKLTQLQGTPLEREARDFIRRAPRNKCMSIPFGHEQKTEMTRLAISTKRAYLCRSKRVRRRRSSSESSEESPRTFTRFGELKSRAENDEGTGPYDR